MIKVNSIEPSSIDDDKWGAFDGKFTTNLNLPNFIGLGNGITRGYGTLLNFTSSKLLNIDDLDYPESDENEYFKSDSVKIDINDLAPLVTWGTSPEDVIDINGYIPKLEDIEDEAKKNAIKRSLDYMGLEAGKPIKGTAIDKVFIGSCTNGRIEDLRAAASILENMKISENVNAMVVPGSGLVKAQAESEGLDKIFIDAGFENYKIINFSEDIATIHMAHKS